MNKFCKNCGTKILNGDYCQKCDNSSVKTSNTQSGSPFYKSTVLNESPNTSEKVEGDLKGLGGWLVIVCINLIYLLYMYGVTAYSGIKMFTDGTVDALSEVQGYAAALGFEAVIQILLFLFLACLIYLFFKKDRRFPQLLIIFLIINTIFIAIDTYIIASGLNYPTTELQQAMQGPIQEGYTQLGRGILSGIVWISYMRVSKRVKLTFIK